MEYAEVHIVLALFHGITIFFLHPSQQICWTVINEKPLKKPRNMTTTMTTYGDMIPLTVKRMVVLFCYAKE